MEHEFITNYFSDQKFEINEITPNISIILFEYIKKDVYPDLTQDVNGIVSFFIACYYGMLKNTNEAIKWLYTSVNKSNARAMNKLGLIYIGQNKITLMKKYFDLAISFGNTDAMTNLARYYRDIEEYDEMEKYLLMAIEAGDVFSMFCLAKYFKEIDDYENMEKYYVLAIKGGCNQAMNNLAIFYDQIAEHEIARDYYLMAIENNNYKSYFNLAYQYEILKEYSLMLKYYLLAYEHGILSAATKLHDFLKDNLDIYPKFITENWNKLPGKIKQISIKNKILPELEKDECDICMETHKIVVLQCNPLHKACTCCFIQLDSCPYCRGDI